MMHEIIPAILPRTSDELEDTFDKLEDKRAYYHLDILEEDVWHNLHTEFEVHLMGKSPEDICHKWVKRGAKRIIVHKLTENILEERSQVDIGLGVEVHIPLKEILPLVKQVDFVQLMSIDNIGAQGRPFEPKIFDRIKELRSAFPEVVIAVDGGVNLDNADDLLYAGADRLVIGSAIFGTEDPHTTYEEFKKLANS